MLIHRSAKGNMYQRLTTFLTYRWEPAPWSRTITVCLFFFLMRFIIFQVIIKFLTLERREAVLRWLTFFFLLVSSCCRFALATWRWSRSSSQLWRPSSRRRSARWRSDGRRDTWEKTSSSWRPQTRWRRLKGQKEIKRREMRSRRAARRPRGWKPAEGR